MCVVGAANALNAVFTGEIFAAGRGIHPRMVKYADDPKLFVWVFAIWVLCNPLNLTLEERAWNNLGAQCRGQHLANAHRFAFEGAASACVAVCKLYQPVDVLIGNRCFNLIFIRQDGFPC